MEIQAKNISKKFVRDWIIKDFNYNFKSEEKYAIVGPNGSGKSTLLQLIAGIIPASKGEFVYELNSKSISSSDIYKFLNISTPYMEVIEDFTLMESLNFHFQFKKLIHLSDLSELIKYIYLENHLNKPVKYFSSGMKQRLKLGLSIFSESSLVLLDEPTSNLDNKGIDWYQQTMDKYSNGRSFIISSNQEYEYSFTNKIIDVRDYQ